MDILESLRKNICEVTFTKANGDERTMICTLIPDFLPTKEAVTNVGPEYIDQIVVWDIEEDAWRSFKPSRVTKIEFSPE